MSGEDPKVIQEDPKEIQENPKKSKRKSKKIQENPKEIRALNLSLNFRIQTQSRLLDLCRTARQITKIYNTLGVASYSGR